ncbi:MAG TPA: 1-acyl-sn-glycerol-3-phosphate acyltransferase [Acholeplasma sp.]|nr:1-acyl-sn-glycerol-3-phosphate acyltransferase [Acholeplasma sp.]
MISILFLLVWFASVYLGYLLVPIWYLIPAWIILGFIIGLLVLFLLLILLMPVMKFTKPNSKFKYHLAKSFAIFLNIFILRIVITSKGRKNIPKTGKLTVYANHKSQTDPVIIMSIFNRGLAFTPKISLYKIPILAQYMNYIGCLPIDREDNRRTAKTMIEAIKNVEKGHAMLIFPEAGIKSRETELMVDARGGAYKIGTKAESDFLPITIIGASKLATRKWWQFSKIKVYVHPVIKHEEVKELTTNELADKMFDIINSKIKE